MDKVVAIIEARMTSTRLPGKVWLDVLGEPMLRKMVRRVAAAKSIKQVVVATTDSDKDLPIANAFCCGHYARAFTGSEEDVLDRVLRAAQYYSADTIVELTGDCPLIDPNMIDLVVAAHKFYQSDFTWNKTPIGAPRGMDVRVFSTTALAQVARKTQDPADREHVSLYFWEHPREYDIHEVKIAHKQGWKDMRLTVDTPEDFELVRSIFEELYPTNPLFTLWDIVELLNRKPHLRAINAHVEQKAVR